MKTKDLEEKVRRTNVFLNNIYKDQRVSELDQVDEYDIVIGDPNAPKSIIFYSKENCPACDDFKYNILPKLQEEYINTGKAKIIHRPLYFPKDSLVSVKHQYAYLLSKSENGDYRQQAPKVLYSNEKSTSSILEQANILPDDKEKFSQYLENNNLRTNFRSRIMFARQSGITRTPTFIVEGKQLVGNRKFSKFEELLSN